MNKARNILGVTVLILLLAARAASALVPAQCGAPISPAAALEAVKP